MTTVPSRPGELDRSIVMSFCSMEKELYRCPHVTPGSGFDGSKSYGETPHLELPPSRKIRAPGRITDQLIEDVSRHAVAQLRPFVPFPDGET
jgi:hypothetical protein